MYTLLLAIIYLVFISLGLPDSLLGSAWPTMRVAFDMPLSSAGIISMIIAGGTICSSLASERLIRRFTTRWVTVISVFLTAIALSGFSLATRFWMLCLWAIPYGLGAGCIDSAMNNYVALHYRSRHMSWLHCFWGVGTIISPYIMSWCITHTRWNDGYQAVSFLQFGIAAVLLLTLPIWKIHAEGGSESSGEAPLGVRGALKIQGAPPCSRASLPTAPGKPPPCSGPAAIWWVPGAWPRTGPQPAGRSFSSASRRDGLPPVSSLTVWATAG